MRVRPIHAVGVEPTAVEVYTLYGTLRQRSATGQLMTGTAIVEMLMKFTTKVILTLAAVIWLPHAPLRKNENGIDLVIQSHSVAAAAETKTAETGITVDGNGIARMLVSDPSPLKGATVADLSPKGVVVLEVDAGSVAQEIGFRPGDIIVALNGLIATTADLDRVIKAGGDKWHITIERGSRQISVMFTGDGNAPDAGGVPNVGSKTSAHTLVDNSPRQTVVIWINERAVQTAVSIAAGAQGRPFFAAQGFFERWIACTVPSGTEVDVTAPSVQRPTHGAGNIDIAFVRVTSHGPQYGCTGAVLASYLK